jgi:hypothetical protein
MGFALVQGNNKSILIREFSSGKCILAGAKAFSPIFLIAKWN